jgi:hypothetical protein
MPPFSMEIGLEAENFLTKMNWLNLEKATEKSQTIPKTHRIQRSTNAKPTRLAPMKRTFEFEFSEAENSPLKLRKPTKKDSNPQKRVFSAGLNSPKNAI